MKTLWIETATEKGALIFESVAVYLPAGAELSRRLAQEVKLLLDDSRPDQIAVGTGPGSFTGIRVGMALGQALAFGWKIPLVGIGSLEGFAPAVEGTFAVVVDARSAGFYVVAGEREGGKIYFENPELLSLERALSFLASFPCLASPHPALIQKRLNSNAMWVETAPHPLLLPLLLESASPVALKPSLCYH